MMISGGRSLSKEFVRKEQRGRAKFSYIRSCQTDYFMNRRNFLRNGSLTGLSLAALTAAGCHTSADKNAGAGGDSAVIADSTGVGGAAAGASPADFSLNEVTIDVLQQKMAQGAYTARSI